MSSNIKNICDHIKNVRSSLQNAEASFRSNNDMRGELDLMLAEAEMQHLREKRGKFGSRIRQRLALLAALLLVLTGAGGWLWAKSSPDPVRSNQIAVETMPAAKKVQTVQTSAVKEAQTADIKNKQAPITQVNQQVFPQEAELPGKLSPALSSDEMHLLVRTARKTLNDTK